MTYALQEEAATRAGTLPDRGPGVERVFDQAYPDEDGIEVIELPDDEGLPVAPSAGADGLLAACARRGFADGRRRGFREAVALTSLAVEELIAARALGEIPPSVLRQVAAALTSRLLGHAPVEPFVEGGLGI